ncbi:MAG: 3'(2'),5'-bisphosphate nucleotidase CysQ [Sedimentisphaerales bacterium]|nr:3'(2'),5'-bisphosphate nucleotidase CysQ [Sedimentisphaerales bacterium]
MIEAVSELARTAGSRILEIYDSGDFETSLKAEDKSPVTKADLEANETIIAGLAEISEYPVVTEESQVEYGVRRKWERFWLVDPLDGTKDFLAKNDEFTVNIALVENCEPVLGLVYAPALGLMYRAQKGRGAYKGSERIFNKSERTELIAADSRFHSTEATLEFLAKHGINTVKKYGSALKLCKLAEGKIDVYPRLNGTKEWDTAAAQLIAEEGGCKVIDIVTRESLVYNKEDIRNNFFIASRKDLDFL